MKISAKKLLIAYLIIIIAIFAGLVLFGDTYSFYISRMDSDNDDVVMETEPEGIIEVKEIEKHDDYYKVTVQAVKPGKTAGTVIYTLNKDNPKELQQYNMAGYTVTNHNVIMTDNYGFGGNDLTFGGIGLMFLVTTIFFGLNFIKRSRTDFFSYRTILDLGLTMYFAITTAVFAGIYVFTAIRHEYFGAAKFFDYSGNALSVLAVLTTPLILIFALFMTLSNIRLIMKEGFRPVNLLGIFISVLLIGGVALCFWLLNYASYLTGNDVKEIMAYVLKTVIASAFIYFECILFATIICLQRAGNYNPGYNKDFIIILGCAIRKDGTLFPLIRGRVDRAIEFYKAQLEATGKKAVFVPSGGQGSDEIISEGEAMKRYLLEQGIEEEQIMPETASTTTLENMKFSEALIRERKPDARVAFSTTSYHVFRGGMFAREAGMDASGMGAKTKWWFWPNAEIREFIGLVVNELWIHIAVVAGLAVLSVIIANLGSIIDFFI